jgi:polysaccharide export outer membrane protein
MGSSITRRCSKIQGGAAVKLKANCVIAPQTQEWGKSVREGQINLSRALFAALFAAVMLFLLRATAAVAAEAPPAGQDHTGPLGVGDWVSIQIAGQPDATGYVGTDGNITVPLVGAVPVAGITAPVAAARVAKALKDGGFFVDPRVTVQVTQPQTQSVSIIGEVQTQGRYAVTPRTTIVDLLAQAGGLKETAGDIGYVLRKDDTGRITRIPVKLNVLADSDATTPALLGGDSLLVPRAEHFSIEGEVATPGRYRIETGMTVMQAIARAGGITERGSERRITLKRVDKPGHYKTLSAKAGDPVQPDDIIRVKESIF